MSVIVAIDDSILEIKRHLKGIESIAFLMFQYEDAVDRDGGEETMYGNIKMSMEQLENILSLLKGLEDEIRQKGLSN